MKHLIERASALSKDYINPHNKSVLTGYYYPRKYNHFILNERYWE